MHWASHLHNIVLPPTSNAVFVRMFASIMFVSTQAVHINMSRHTKMSLKFSQVGNTPAYSFKGADLRSTFLARMFALRAEKTSSQFTRVRVTLSFPPTLICIFERVFALRAEQIGAHFIRVCARAFNPLFIIRQTWLAPSAFAAPREGRGPL